MDVLIPLGGKGSRFLALSEYHKSLLPFKGKIIFEHILDSISAIQDIPSKHFIFVLGPQKERIAHFLERYKSKHASFDYDCVEQKEMYDGPLAAVYYALGNLHHDRVFLHLGDLIMKDGQGLDFGSDFLGVQRVPDFERWCMVDHDLLFYDKSKTRPPTDLALNGLYFFSDTALLKETTIEVMRNQRPLVGTEYQFSQMMALYSKGRTPDQRFRLVASGVTDFGTIDDLLVANDFRKCRSFCSLDDASNSRVTKKSRGSKLCKEFAHLKLLSAMGLLPTPAIHSILREPDGAYAMEMDRVIGKPLDYLYMFEEYDRRYFREVFTRVVQDLRRLTDTNGSCDADRDLESVISARGQNGLMSYLDRLDRSAVLTHGDFHFGNMILEADGADSRIMYVDPSGRFWHRKYYDLAKLIHGGIYDYNLIKFGLYSREGDEVTLYNRHLEKRRILFQEVLERYFEPDELAQAKVISMILFKTMQPLHQDNPEHVAIFDSIHRRLKAEIDAGDFSLKGRTDYNLSQPEP